MLYITHLTTFYSLLFEPKSCYIGLQFSSNCNTYYFNFIYHVTRKSPMNSHLNMYILWGFFSAAARCMSFSNLYVGSKVLNTGWFRTHKNTSCHTPFTLIDHLRGSPDVTQPGPLSDKEYSRHLRVRAKNHLIKDTLLHPHPLRHSSFRSVFEAEVS